MCNKPLHVLLSEQRSFECWFGEMIARTSLILLKRHGFPSWMRIFTFHMVSSESVPAPFLPGCRRH